jgi:tRNA pseudouridine55 synthase
LPQELSARPVKVSKLELVEWFDKHSFPTPKEEASEELKSFELSISKKKPRYTAPEKSPVTTTIGPACKLRMTVSSGFYVRSLCYDLGIKLDSGAYMAELVRTRQGEFSIENAIEWEEFKEGGGWEDKVVRILNDESAKAS